MAYKNLILHVDSTRACASRNAVAIQLAATLQAHLTAVYVVPEFIAAGFAGAYLNADLQSAIGRELGDRGKAALAAFEEAARRQAISYETRLELGYEAEFADLLALHARYADLMILGQPDPDDDSAGGRHLPERVVLGSGRPALMLPYIGARLTIGQRVAIAWDASREAARAVADAMPFLAQARAVTVVLVNPRPSWLGHGAEPGADIALHLARHGIKVEVKRIEAPDLDPADALLAHIADDSIDLLVMGLYGHSRLRETVLGGVSRKMLQSMTVPVLMAH
jgi:nucleotide-binding universal stress UspA family protein